MVAGLRCHLDLVPLYGFVTVPGLVTLPSLVTLASLVTLGGFVLFPGLLPLPGLITIPGLVDVPGLVSFHGLMVVGGLVCWSRRAWDLYFRILTYQQGLCSKTIVGCTSCGLGFQERIEWGNAPLGGWL